MGVLGTKFHEPRSKTVGDIQGKVTGRTDRRTNFDKGNFEVPYREKYFFLNLIFKLCGILSETKCHF